MTGSIWHNLSAAAILSLQALREHLLEPTREQGRQVLADLFGGGGGGVIGSTKASLTYSSSTLSLDFDREAVTGRGHRLSLSWIDPAWTSVPYANSGATTYYVGAQAQDRPTRAVTGLGGVIQYEAVEEDVGTLGVPDLVTDNGDGTITLRISTLVAPVWSVGGTRPVVVWLVDPVTSSSEAIYEGTASASGGHVVVTTTHALGQDPVSTTAADYQVLVRGPRVTTTNIATNPDYFFLGTVISTTFSAAAQVAFPPFYALFDVEHDSATGVHNRVRINGSDDGLEILDAGWVTLSGGGSIDVTNGDVLLGAGSVVVTNGHVETDPVASSVPGFKYAQAVTFSEDVGPRSGGWFPDAPATAQIARVAGTPSYVTSSSTTAALTMRRPLVTWPSSDHTTRWTIVSVATRYIRTNVTDSVVISVKRQKRDGTGAEATVATVSPGATAVFAVSTLAVAHTVDSAYAYWLEITLDPFAVAADAAVADVILTVSKVAVE